MYFLKVVGESFTHWINLENATVIQDVDLVASLQGEIENLRYAMEHHDTSRR